MYEPPLEAYNLVSEDAFCSAVAPDIEQDGTWKEIYPFIQLRYLTWVFDAYCDMFLVLRCQDAHSWTSLLENERYSDSTNENTLLQD